MTADLDRLELELRSVPGIIAVGFDRDASGELRIQAVAMSSTVPDDLHDRLRRIVTANIRDGVRLDIVVDSIDSAPSIDSAE
jgi:hypothetical protein